MWAPLGFLTPDGMPLAPDKFVSGSSDRHEDGARVAAALFARLTGQQRLVAVWRVAGFSSEEIARHLGITRQELRLELHEIARVVQRLVP